MRGAIIPTDIVLNVLLPWTSPLLPRLLCPTLSDIVSKHPAVIPRAAKAWVKEYQDQDERAEAMSRLMSLIVQVTYTYIHWIM